MKTKKWMSMTASAAALLLGSACTHDWGQMDPPAGDQVYPTMQGIATYAFDAEEELDPLVINLYAYPEGETPALYEDELAQSPVLNLASGYARFNNPLKNVAVQNAVSYTFWMKQNSDPVLDEDGNPVEGQVMPQDLTSPIMYWENENASASLSFSANGWLKYDGLDGKWEENNPEAYKTGYLTPDLWHYVALIIRDHGYALYVDGEKKADITSSDLDYSNAVQFASNAPYMYFNYGADTHTSIYLEDLNIYRNEITAKQIARPKKGIIWGNTGGGGSVVTLPEPIYFNDFDEGANGATVYGSGSFQWKGGSVGGVYCNGRGVVRGNYLILPNNLFEQSKETKGITVSFWVNRGDETNSSDYLWAPIFSAYASQKSENGGEAMFVAQYRGLLQINDFAGHWCDYTDGQNVAGTNKIWHGDNDWLADGKWHHYAFTITPESATVYFDGEVANSWETSGDGNGGSADGIFMNGELYKHIALGGNQAWNWGDPDAGFWYDELSVYNEGFTQDQIKRLMSAHNTSYFNDFEYGLDGSEIIGDGEITNSGNDMFGSVFANAMNGMRTNYLLLPSDALQHSGKSEELSIGVWVNQGNETDPGHYQWSPLFSAYEVAPQGSNGMSMFLWTYRGTLQINCNGPANVGDNWSDFTAEQHVDGEVHFINNDKDPLKDGEWHYYTAVFTKTNVKLYVDGKVTNEWNLTGSGAGNTIGFLNGENPLVYVCLGGNQAWNWGDPDPGFWFDEVAIYKYALTSADIADIIAKKSK